MLFAYAVPLASASDKALFGNSGKLGYDFYTSNTIKRLIGIYLNKVRPFHRSLCCRICLFFEGGGYTAGNEFNFVVNLFCLGYCGMISSIRCNHLR